MPTIEVRSLSKNFGHVKALTDINLKINDGEFVGIIGPSGCGKSTLINCITGIVKPTTGRIFIDGKDVTDIPIEDREFAMVFQNISLFPHMSVYENVEYPSVIKDLPDHERDDQTEKALKLVDLLEEKHLYPAELSGGAKQKAAVARAIARHAKILILDEPISALDLKVRVELRYEIKRLVKDLGLTALHITHDQEEVMSISDRVVLMKAGRIIEIKTPKDLYMHPDSLFTLNFVGESNFLEGYISNKSDSSVVVRLRNRIDYEIGIATPLEIGEAVVVAVRPENVYIASDGKGLKGKVIENRFFGSYWRTIVELITEDIIMIDHQQSVEKGKEVTINFTKDRIYIYKLPEKGLLEELSLE